MMRDRFFWLVGSLLIFFSICFPVFGSSQQIQDSLSKNQIVFITGDAKVFGQENLYIREENNKVSKKEVSKEDTNPITKKKLVSIASKKAKENKVLSKIKVKNEVNVIYSQSDATTFFVNKSATLKFGILTSIFVGQYAKEVEVVQVPRIVFFSENIVFDLKNRFYSSKSSTCFSIRPPPFIS